MPCPLLALLPGVNRTTISRAIGDTLPLLDQHASAIPRPATTRIRTLADLHAYATAKATTPAQKINQRANHLRALTACGCWLPPW